MSQQVGRAKLTIPDIVGNHQRLSWPGEQVDTYAAEQLPLGLRHIGIAGSDQHVDGRDARRAEGHGAHGLDAAKAIDLVGTGQLLRCDDCRGGFALERRRAGDDAWHAGHLCRDHRHMGRGKHRILAARHVAPGGFHGDVLVPQHHARQRLDLDVSQRVALLLRKVTYLRLCKLYVVDIALGELG